MQNWDDMRVFLAVARAQSLSGAAPALKMDPATVSRRIARLEAGVGAALFVKSPQGYALTELGVRMRDEAGVAEGALSRAMNAGDGATDQLSGQIRIGAPDGCATFILPQVCGQIQADNPGLEVQILSLPRVVNLSRREADMAITVSPPQANRMKVEKITDYHLHLAMRRDLPVPQNLKEARAHPVIGYIQDMIFDRALDYLDGLADQGVQLASNSVSVQLQMLRQSAGIGVVHDFALPFAPELHAVLTEDLSLMRAFYLVRHASDRSSDRLSRFAALLMQGIRAEVARLENLTAQAKMDED